MPIPKFKPMTNPLHGWHLPLHQGPTSLKFNTSRSKMELHLLFNNAWINFASPFPYFKWSRKSSLSSWHSTSIHHFIFLFAITKKNKSNRASTTVMYPLNFVILFFFFFFRIKSEAEMTGFLSISRSCFLIETNMGAIWSPLSQEGQTRKILKSLTKRWNQGFRPWK